MTWKWYGVKTVYRILATGRPKSVDDRFDNEATGVEERVVLIRARSFDEAITKGEAEAVDYASYEWVNPYGQKVRARFLGVTDADELFDEPGVNVEVYSATQIVPKTVSNKELIDQRFGPYETKAMHKKRRKFFHA